MSMKKTKVINIFGEPGAGKSKAAAYLYAKLKFDGIDVEMCREVAKDAYYANLKNITQSSIYLRQKQRLAVLYGKVDVIITDSPLPLAILYYDGVLLPAFEDVVMREFTKYDNVNLLANRVGTYDTRGRWQNEEESLNIRTKLHDLLDRQRVPYSAFCSDQEGCEKIYPYLRQCLYKF